MQFVVPVLAVLYLSCFVPAHQQSDEKTDSLPLTPPIASAEVVEQNDATCPSVQAQNVVKDTLQPLILSIADTVVPCTLQVKGQVPNCPASNCTELFNLAQEEGLIFMSGYYWLVPNTGRARKVYCNQVTRQPEYSSCEEVFEFQNQSLPISGFYTIRSSEDSPVTVYCDMDSEGCGGGGWTRVASYNYSDPSLACPSTWTQLSTPFRGCTLTNVGCASSSFSTPVEFSQVCGKVIAIQRDTPDGFAGPDDINSIYVDGVSITYGSPRQHIWSFSAFPHDTHPVVSRLCPCSNPSLNVPPPPSFVGQNYFCDTGIATPRGGWHTGDPLWDGQGCHNASTCCSFNNPPWFSTTLPQITTDDIEVRICRRAGSSPNDNTAIILLDLYIK